MNTMMGAGFLCGAAAGICLLIVMKKLMKKDRSAKCQYDERQQMVRARGFQYGFFGWLIFDAVYIALDIGLGIQYMDTAMALLSGMLIGISIYASYAIWNEGYFSLNTYPGRVTAFLAAAAVLNIICAVRHLEEGLLKDGMLTFLKGANLICAAAAILVFAVLIAKWCSDRRKEE